MPTSASESFTCDTCGRFDIPGIAGGGHRCPPVWTVWEPQHGDREEDGVPIYAHDAQEAAERWAAERDQNGDYAIVRGECAHVVVAGPDGQHTALVVTGEAVPSYRAVQPR